MALRPRFGRVAGVRRAFVDRDDAIAVFLEELALVGDGPRVVNVTGVGGIGKSRLLQELLSRVREAHRTASLDLQVPAMRQQDAALSVLRSAFGRQGVRFDRYDIAFVALWQRLHPHLRVDAHRLPLVAESELLAEIIDGASGVPVFGTAVALAKLADAAAGRLRRRRSLRNDPTLAALDGLGNADLADAVTFLFAEDLRSALTDGRSFVLCVDAHEAMVAGGVRAGRLTAADTWLRDLVAQLDGGLTVVASREPLGWERHDAAWADVIRVVPLTDLPVVARLELLGNGGLDDPVLRSRIARASAGVPFYLELALDTWERRDGSDTAVVVSQAEILDRFLLHVDPHDVRLLELLSIPRLFDYEIFRVLAEAFDLPCNRLAWESLTAYSFVHRAGGAFVRLHQLMVEALRARLSDAVAAEADGLVAGVWHRWINQADDSAGLPVGAMVREAVYHRLRAGLLTGADLLAYADAAVADADAQSIEGIMVDMRDGLASGPPTDPAVDAALLCLEAEAAVRVGDAARAVALTSDADGNRLESVTDVRLAVAAAHGRRILGETAAALRIYTAVWDHPAWDEPDADRLDPCQRRIAGHWAADLHMAQGRFAEAHAMAEDILADLTDTEADAEVAGDLHRLLYLASRFAFDFEAAEHHLGRAEAAYRRARSVVGLANIAVNRAELLAWTEPAAAIRAADKALDKQQDIGAQHEIGKAYTAMAFALAHLGATQRGHAALALACEALERAGYRSGRARAELVRAVLHQREGRTDLACAAARHAVAEFVQVEVYPTYILLAEQLLDLAECSDADVSAAATRARAAIHPVGNAAELAHRIRAHIAAVLQAASVIPTSQRDPTDPLALYAAARSAPAAAAGFYNHNVRVSTPTGPVMVRIPISGADEMDLRVWAEQDVLRAIEPYVPEAPRVLHVQRSPAFQIHQYVEGDLLDDIAPRGVPVAPLFLEDAAVLFDRLGDVPGDVLPRLPRDWPDDGDSPAFAARLSDVTARVWDRFRHDYGPLYAALGVPAVPLAPVRDAWAGLTPRPFRLLHCDVHRKNVIVRADGHAVFLDWELALWGDPVYDLAVHLHKMTYSAPEQERLLEAWERRLAPAATANWRDDLPRYLIHERVKSAIVDTVRYTKLLAAPDASSSRSPETLIGSLTTKLNAAGAVWGWTAPTDEQTVERSIRAFLRGWDGRLSVEA